MTISHTLKKESNLAFIFCCSLAFRVIKLILDPLLLRDSALYLFYSDIWYNTNNYSEITNIDTTVPPFPLFTIKEMMKMGFNSEITGRSISLFLGSLIPVLGYVIAKRCFKDKRIALITSIIFIIHPTLISYSIQPLRENYYLFFLELTIIEAINGIAKRSFISWFLCGCFLSITFFCRYEALEMIIIYSSLILFLSFKKKYTKRATLGNLASFYIACALTAALLLSITDYDLSFIKRVSRYKGNLFHEYNIGDTSDDNSQISQ